MLAQVGLFAALFFVSVAFIVFIWVYMLKIMEWAFGEKETLFRFLMGLLIIALIFVAYFGAVGTIVRTLWPEIK